MKNEIEAKDQSNYDKIIEAIKQIEKVDYPKPSYIYFSCKKHDYHSFEGKSGMFERCIKCGELKDK